MKKEEFYKLIEMMKSQDDNIRDLEKLGLRLGDSKLIQDNDAIVDLLLHELFGEEATSQIYEFIYLNVNGIQTVEDLYLTIINQNE